MTGLARRTGGSLRLLRTGIEVSVLVIGFLLGGTVGVGTVLYALAIGPLVQFFLPKVAVPHTKDANGVTMTTWPVRPQRSDEARDTTPSSA
jgi:uncharacterized membrane protein YczE